LLEEALPAVHRLVSFRLGANSPAIEDVVQETLVACLSSFQKLKGDDHARFLSWVFKVARFKVADHFRGESKGRRVGEAMLAQPISASLDIAEAAVESDSMRHALASLTKDQQEVLVLRFVVDMSLDEVAAITKRSPGAVKALQHRGLATIARKLGVGDA
jgi:RNA polymerase sigma-70 factor (ECF subfamily)